MTWWWGTVRAAWRRYDTWLEHFKADRAGKEQKKADKDRLSEWWKAGRQWSGVQDTGSIVATPEDLAEIGPADPVHVPGQRRGRHRLGGPL